MASSVFFCNCVFIQSEYLWQNKCDERRSGLGERVAWRADVPPCSRSAAAPPGSQQEESAAREVCQRRAHEDTELPSPDTACSSEALRSAQEVLYAVASGPRDWWEVRRAFPGPSHIIRLLSLFTYHPRPQCQDCYHQGIVHLPLENMSKVQSL